MCLPISRRLHGSQKITGPGLCADRLGGSDQSAPLTETGRRSCWRQSSREHRPSGGGALSDWLPFPRADRPSRLRYRGRPPLHLLLLFRPEVPLWGGIFWSAVFTLVNGVMIARVIVDRTKFRMSDEHCHQKIRPRSSQYWSSHFYWRGCVPSCPASLGHGDGRRRRPLCGLGPFVATTPTGSRAVPRGLALRCAQQGYGRQGGARLTWMFLNE